jgi:hypothetical protein
MGAPFGGVNVFAEPIAAGPVFPVLPAGAVK